MKKIWLEEDYSCHYLCVRTPKDELHKSLHLEADELFELKLEIEKFLFKENESNIKFLREKLKK